MYFPSPSPGPKWEALQEPQSSDDELDAEDGGDALGSAWAHPNTHTEATRGRPSAFATNAVVGESSRSPTKRKEADSPFTSKKRARYSDHDGMDLDLDEHAKDERYKGVNRKAASEKRIMGLGSSQPSTTLNRKISISNDSASPLTSTGVKRNLMRKSSGMRPPPFPSKRLSESGAASTRDPPSKLAGLPFDTYKRTESKSVAVSDSGRSASVVDKGKGKVPVKYERMPSGSQTARRPSKAIPPDAEIIEISKDDDSPPPSISQAKVKVNAIRPPPLRSVSAPGRGSRTSGIASASAPRSPIKKFLPRAPIEVIEIFDSDDEQLPMKAQEKSVVDRSSGSRLSDLEEYATGLNSQISSAGGNGFADVMNIDGEVPSSVQPASAVPAVGTAHSDSEDDLFNFNIPSSPPALSQDDLFSFDIPSSPPALSQELEATDHNQAVRGLIPLPSSSPSSIGLSPKDNSLSTPPVPITSIASLTISSPPEQPSILTSSFDSLRKPITAEPSASAGPSTGSSSSRLGFSTVAIPSSLQAFRPADKHLRQFARKIATQAKSDEDEDSSGESSGKQRTAHTKTNKGKEKEIRESSSSDVGSIGMRAPLAMESDMLKEQVVSTTMPKIQGQTLAEAITSAGQLNRTKKKKGRRLQGNTNDAPIDLTSDVEAGATADENEKALKAVIGSSRLLVNLLPTLKEKSSIRAAAAKVNEPLASSPQEKRILLSPTRTQDFPAKAEPPESPSTTKIGKSSHPLPSPKRNNMAHDMSSQMSPLPLPAEMKLKSGSPGHILGATPQPKGEPTTAFEFKSGTAVIEPLKDGPPKKIPLPKRPSAATIERILAARSGTSQQTSPTIDLSGEGTGKAPMTEVSSRKSTSPISGNISAPSAAPLMTPSSIPLPLSPLQPALQDSSSSMPIKLFKRLTPPKSSPLAMTEASSVPDGSTLSQQTPSTSTVNLQSGHDDASMTTPKSSSPKLVDVPPAVMSDSDDVQAQSLSKQPTLPAVVVPKSPELPVTTSIFPETTSTTANASIAALEAVKTSKAPLSIVPTNSSDAAVQDESSDSFGLSFNDSPDDDEEECQALLQTPDYMDVVPSHDVQPSLQDSIVVRHKSRITSVTSPSPLTSVSAKASNERASVSPPIPDVRRSSRISSSRSSSSGGLGTPFDYDFGPFDSVPATRSPSPEIQKIPTLSTPPKTYGGFRALTWKDYRANLNNFTRRTFYAKDLPHALQDHINSMSEYTQMMKGMRDLFEATILENTVEDEPDAPSIEIWNNVDTQSTPPWEFYYTNNMWLGEGVPPPDIKNLVSCTCKGGCNPKSKTCACLLRQRKAAGDPYLEFAYDKNGKLKVPGYPIFECNDLCGCSEECRNRVVQHGRKVSVNIGKTKTKGWGVFAGPKKIPEGTFIGIYSGELLTDAEAHERGIKYNKSGRTYLFDIDFHHLKEGNPDWEISFTVDAYHAGNFTRFLNHSCDPNCRLYACYINEGNIQKPLLAIFTRRDIEPHEEICFNYQGIYDDGEDEDEDDDDDDDGNDYKILDPDHGTDMIYVRCRCGAKNCTGTMFK